MSERTISADSVALLYKIGDMIRGDWSGKEFDGRDVKRWIETALSDNLPEIQNLLGRLNKWYEP